MAGTIATFLANASTINSHADAKGPQRHAYNELVDLQAKGDPELASPYLKASANSVIAATGGTSGNMTITMNFPKYGVSVTTGNVAFNASVAAVQTLVDSALSGEEILATYVADDVKCSGAGTIDANALTITANGTTVNGAQMVVTTANADLDSWPVAVTANVVGTQNRPAEAILAQQSVITPDSAVTPQGNSPSEGDYVVGDNPQSLSPGLKDILILSIQADEDKTLGDYLRGFTGCVE